MDIIFQIDKPFQNEIDPTSIEKALQLTLQRFNQITAATLSVVITDGDTVRQLNHQYRGLDTPTDVLSFENIPDPDFPDAGEEHLGDVVISYPVAAAQAVAAGHTPGEEVILLAVHGTLHLVGLDHDTAANKETMWAIQRQILAELGLGHVQPTEA